MLTRKVVVFFSGQWMSQVLQLGASLLLARALGPVSMGQIAFAMGVAGSLMLFTGLGLPQAHIKRIAEGQRFSEYVLTYSAVTMALQLLTLALAASVWPLLASSFQRGEPRQVLFTIGGFYVLNNLVTIPLLTLQGLNEVGAQSRIMIYGRIARLAWIVLGIGLHWPTRRMVFCFFLDAGLQFVLGLAYLRRHMDGFRWPAASDFEAYWRYAKPLAMLSPVSLLADSIDKVILGLYVPAAELGVYSISRSLFEAMKSIPSSIVSVLGPQVTREYVQGNLTQIRERFAGAMRKGLLVSTLVFACGIILAPLAILIAYGASYTGSWPSVEVLIGVAWVITLISPLHYVLYAVERHQTFVYISPIGQFCYFLGLWIMISPLRWGSVGAALAQALPWVTTLLFIAPLAKKHLGLSLSPRSWIPYAGIMLIAYTSYGCTYTLHPWMQAIIGLPILTIACLLTHHFVPLWTSDDLESIFSAFHPRRVWQGVFS